MVLGFNHNNLPRSIFVAVLVAVLAIFACIKRNQVNTHEGDKEDKMSMTKEFFLIAPSAKATATVIFLHGLGDTGKGWSLAFDEFKSKKKHIRYIFPNAPSIPVSLNGGMVMPSWYDIRALSPDGNEDKPGIEAAAERIRQLILKETQEHGIPSERIILGGFSMGGALALYTALTHPETLGGVIALSSYLPLHKTFTKEKLCKQKCNIFQGHGEHDPMVSPQFGQLTHEILKGARSSIDVTTELKMYNMAHTSCDQELDDVESVIGRWVPEV